MRMKKVDYPKPSGFLLSSSSRLITNIPIFHQPPLQVKGLDGLMRTSLDLELDLQVSRTRQARLLQELHVLRELKAQLEKVRQQGRRELPAWVQEDERFRLLLKQAEKQVSHFPLGVRPDVFFSNPFTTFGVDHPDPRRAAAREEGGEDDEGSSKGRPQNQGTESQRSSRGPDLQVGKGGLKFSKKIHCIVLRSTFFLSSDHCSVWP